MYDSHVLLRTFNLIHMILSSELARLARCHCISCVSVRCAHNKLLGRNVCILQTTVHNCRATFCLLSELRQDVRCNELGQSLAHTPVAT